MTSKIQRIFHKTIGTITKIKRRLKIFKTAIRRNLKEIIITTILFLTALATRTYMLDKFPYFPKEWPYLGDKPGPPGLYGDEAFYLSLAKRIPERLPAYQPWLQLILIKLSILTLGESAFSARLPSAIFGSLNTILIYLIVRKLYKDWKAATISALFYIAMTPALIYNRMVFLENGVSFFLLLTLYTALKYDETNNDNWLLASITSSVLATYCKINGLATVVYLIIHLLQRNKKKKALAAAFLASIPILAFIITSYALRIEYFQGMEKATKSFRRQWWIGLIGKEMSLYQYMIIPSLPSGVLLQLISGYIPLEYWYLFTYFTIIYIYIHKPKETQPIATAIISFLATMIMVWGAGSYYLTIIQPLLAATTGPAILGMKKMTPIQTLLLTLLIYTPLITTIIATLPSERPKISIDYQRYQLKIILLGIPLLINILNTTPIIKKKHIPAIITTTLTLIALITGSYITNTLYPHYFNVIPQKP